MAEPADAIAEPGSRPRGHWPVLLITGALFAVAGGILAPGAPPPSAAPPRATPTSATPTSATLAGAAPTGAAPSRDQPIPASETIPTRETAQRPVPAQTPVPAQPPESAQSPRWILDSADYASWRRTAAAADMVVRGTAVAVLAAGPEGTVLAASRQGTSPATSQEGTPRVARPEGTAAVAGPEGTPPATSPEGTPRVARPEGTAAVAGPEGTQRDSRRAGAAPGNRSDLPVRVWLVRTTAPEQDGRMRRIGVVLPDSRYVSGPADAALAPGTEADFALRCYGHRLGTIRVCSTVAAGRGVRTRSRG